MNEAAVGDIAGKLFDQVFGAITSPGLFVLVFAFMQSFKLMDKEVWRRNDAKSKRDPRQSGYFHPFYSFISIAIGVPFAFLLTVAYPNATWQITLIEGLVHGAATMLLYQNLIDPFIVTPMKIKRAKQQKELDAIERGRG